MSESIGHDSVAWQILELATLAGRTCDEFQHQVIDSKVSFAGGPATKDLISLTTAQNGGLIITRIEVKTLFDTTDATLGTGTADWRSTFDFNPYGPFAGGSSDVGTIVLTEDGTPSFSTAFDFGVINRSVLFPIKGGVAVKIIANPNQPAGKNIELVTAVTAFTVAEEVIQYLKKNRTQIITQ